jgi:hypothetical protein
MLRNYFQVCKLHSLETKEDIFPALVIRCPDVVSCYGSCLILLI